MTEQTLTKPVSQNIQKTMNALSGTLSRLKSAFCPEAELEVNHAKVFINDVYDINQNTYTKIPNTYLNIIAPQLSRASQSIMSYIYRHTLGFHLPDGTPKTYDRISLSQFCKGIKTLNDQEETVQFDYGANLSKGAVIRNIKILTEVGVIFTFKCRNTLGVAEKWYFINTKENRVIVDALNQKLIFRSALTKLHPNQVYELAMKKLSGEVVETESVGQTPASKRMDAQMENTPAEKPEKQSHPQKEQPKLEVQIPVQEVKEIKEFKRIPVPEDYQTDLDFNNLMVHPVNEAHENYVSPIQVNDVQKKAILSADVITDNCSHKQRARDYLYKYLTEHVKMDTFEVKYLMKQFEPLKVLNRLGRIIDTDGIELLPYKLAHNLLGNPSDIPGDTCDADSNTQEYLHAHGMRFMRLTSIEDKYLPQYDLITERYNEKIKVKPTPEQLKEKILAFGVTLDTVKRLFESTDYDKIFIMYYKTLKTIPAENSRAPYFVSLARKGNEFFDSEYKEMVDKEYNYTPEFKEKCIMNSFIMKVWNVNYVNVSNPFEDANTSIVIDNALFRAEQYKQKFGNYPERILAKIKFTKENYENRVETMFKDKYFKSKKTLEAMLALVE